MYVSKGKEKYNAYGIVILRPTKFCTTRVYKEVKEREQTSLLLFPLDEVNNSWTNARSDFSDVSSQAACG